MAAGGLCGEIGEMSDSKLFHEHAGRIGITVCYVRWIRKNLEYLQLIYRGGVNDLVLHIRLQFRDGKSPVFKQSGAHGKGISP